MNVRDRLRTGLQVRSNEDGFTLIELLIVMSVMLILMTLAVPQLLKLRKQAQELTRRMACPARWRRWEGIRSLARRPRRRLS
jgi:prepilin-type N-terminal cleavage/methylation domain-containing protein